MGVILGVCFFLQETSPFQLFIAAVLVFFSRPDNWRECTRALLNRASKHGVCWLQGNLLKDECEKHWIVSGWSPVVLSRLPRLSHNKAELRYSLRNSWAASAKASSNHGSDVSFLKWKWEVCRDEMWNLCCSSCDASTLPSILPFKGATKRLKVKLGTKLQQRRNQLKPLLAHYKWWKSKIVITSTAEIPHEVGNTMAPSRRALNPPSFGPLFIKDSFYYKPGTNLHP